MFAPQVNPFESIMSGKGGEMETIGPYIPSDDNRGVELFGDNLRFALIPGDDELGDIIRQQDRDILDEYRRIDGENRDPFAPLPIRKAGKFITDLMA